MKPGFTAAKEGLRQVRLRRAAWVALAAFILNIILPFASTVAALQTSAAGHAWPWAEAAICSADKDQAPPASKDPGDRRPACPLCLLLGGQALAPNPGTTTLTALPDRVEPAPPPARTSPGIRSPVRRQAARAPPVPV